MRERQYLKCVQGFFFFFFFFFNACLQLASVCMLVRSSSECLCKSLVSFYVFVSVSFNLYVCVKNVIAQGSHGKKKKKSKNQKI